MKYGRFIKNIFTRKKKNKHELIFNDDSVEYDIIYTNNYMDTLFNILKKYNLLKNKNLSSYNIYECIDDNKSNIMEEIIREILISNNSKDLLSILSNIIIRIEINNNNNWLKILHAMNNTANSAILVSNDNNCIYISLNMSDINTITKFNSDEKCVVDIIKHMVQDYYDDIFRTDKCYDKYFSSNINLGLGYNIPCSAPSIFNDDGKFVVDGVTYDLVGIDIIEECPFLSKAYIVSRKASLNNYSLSSSINNELILHTVPIRSIIESEDEISENLTNMIIEKYATHYIYLNDLKNEPSISYDDIDEIM